MSLLSIALGTALAAMVPGQAMAQATTIDSSNSYNTAYTLSGSDLTITNTGSIASTSGNALIIGTLPVGTIDNGGSITAFATGIVLSTTSTVDTITNSGRIYGNSAAMEINGSIGTLNNSGTIAGGMAGIDLAQGTIDSIVNTATGTISATYGVYNNAGVISSLNNQGLISGTVYAVLNTNSATIATLTNSGTITGGYAGISNSGQIDILNNSGVITETSSSGTLAGISNASTGTITNLTNDGTISGVALAVFNAGHINTLTNTGLIKETGTLSAIYNTVTGTIDNLLVDGGTITGYNGINNVGLITNLDVSAGTIYGSVAAVVNSAGTIATLTNAGLIQGGVTGILNLATIGTLSNSGVITGSLYALALSSSASLGTLNNSGLVAGNLINLSPNSITINGGTGTIFGTLTGSSGATTSSAIGSIANSNSNLIFNSGNILLNDNINVGSHTVSNVASTLQLNNHLTITGNYNQGASATLLIGVNDGATATGSASDTGYGYLYVTGNSTIASGSTIGLTKTNSYAFANGQRYVVLITTGTANYSTSSLNYVLDGYTVTGTNVTEDGNINLVLTLGTTTTDGNTSTVSTAVTNYRYATTSNAKSSLGGLFNYDGANLSLTNLFNAATRLDSTAAANSAGAKLSPTANTVAATQSATAATNQVLEVVAAHVDGLRVAQANGDSGVATGEGANNWAVWGQAFGGAAHQGMRDNVSGFRSRYTGLVLGADSLVSERWRAGALLSYASNSVDGRDDNTGSSARVNSYGLMGYGGYAADGWYVDMAAGAIEHKYNSTRVIDFDTFSGVANGSFNGVQYATSVQAGMPFKLSGAWERTTLTPIAGLGYSITRQNGYTETGGNGAALSVNSSKSSSLKSELAVKLERSFTTAFGDVVPAAQFGWRHEFHDRAVQSVSSFALDSTGSTSFTSSGATPVSDTGVLALSATLVRNHNLTVVARYTLEAGSGYVGQTGDVRLRYQF